MLFFVVPVWGILSDKKGNRPVLQFALFLSIILLWGFQYLSSFWAIISYIIFLAFFIHPNGTLLDSLAIAHLQQDHKHSFGAMRVWGSAGWAIGTIFMGRYLVSRDLHLIFPAASIALLLTFLTTFLVKTDKTDTHLYKKLKLNQIVTVFGKKHIYLFFILLLLYGISVSPTFIFINLYLHDIGASNQLIGIVFAIHALSEIPFFFYGRGIVNRFGSKNVLLAIIWILVIRLFAYSIISTPIIAAFAGIFHGLTFSLFWLAVIDVVHKLIPQEWRATGQSLIWAFHVGAGLTIGNMMIGRLSDFIPMQKVMLLGALSTVVVGCATFIYFRAFKKEMAA